MPESSAKLTRFVAGDPLRAVSALAVLVFHVALFVLFTGSGRFEQGKALGSVPIDVLTSLEVGIYVFFTLSGYLLGRRFVSAFHEGSALPPTGRYLRDRVLRILPAFWFVALACLVYFGRRGSSWSDVIAVFGFAQAWVGQSGYQAVMLQAWTLGAELLFYLGLPVVAAGLVATVGRLPRGRLRLGLATAVLGAGTVLSFAARVTGTDAPEDFHTPPTMLFAFAPGVVLAAVEVLWLSRLRGLRAGRPLALVLSVSGLTLLAVYAALDRDDVTARVLLGTIGCALIVAGPLLLEWTTGKAWRALDNPLMDWVGVRSYSIYLAHVGVLVALSSTYDNGLSLWPALLVAGVVGVPATLVISALVYRFVEAPFLRLRGRRLTRSRPDADPAAAI